MIPHELVSRYVIPYLRGLTACRLIDEGLSQHSVAKLLGVTQPMVRKYVRVGEERLTRRLVGVGIPKEEVETIVKVLTHTALRGSRYDLDRLLSQIINSMLSRLMLCNFHRRVDPTVPSNCRLCSALFTQVPDPYVEDVRAALKLIQATEGSHTLAPEVGINIVRAPPGASTPEEVVGIAGRVIRVASGLVAVGEPTYGGSRHTASVLLTLRERWGGVGAAMVIRYSEEFVERLKASGLKLLTVGPHESAGRFFEDLKEAVREVEEVPDAVVDLGGIGLEPVIYLLGTSAVEAARKALLALRAEGEGIIRR